MTEREEIETLRAQSMRLLRPGATTEDVQHAEAITNALREHRMAHGAPPKGKRKPHIPEDIAR